MTLLAEAPLDHVRINLADHVGIHVNDIVVLAEDFERFAGKDKLNKQFGMSDGKIELYESVLWPTSDPDVAGQLVEAFCMLLWVATAGATAVPSIETCRQ